MSEEQSLYDRLIEMGNEIARVANGHMEEAADKTEKAVDVLNMIIYDIEEEVLGKNRLVERLEEVCRMLS